jgi:hypothetical protein
MTQAATALYIYLRHGYNCGKLLLNSDETAIAVTTDG